jgi:hypothetical protein
MNLLNLITTCFEIILHNKSHLEVLRLLESNPHMSQRDLSDALGVSLGKN